MQKVRSRQFAKLLRCKNHIHSNRTPNAKYKEEHSLVLRYNPYKKIHPLFIIWSVTLIGKRLVLKTSVALKSDKGSNPLHSAN